MIYYTSDTHFGHRNVIKYCSRPFLIDPTKGFEDDNLDVPAMNKAMIDRWNEVVKDEDTVYHLGDVGFGPKEAIKECVTQLRGYKILVRGNHDGSMTRAKSYGFDEVHDEVYLSTELEGVVVPFALTHRPTIFDSVGFCLHGHVHEKYGRQDNRYNVGVDQYQFRPVTLEQIFERFGRP